jgi:hypothetical protein
MDYLDEGEKAAMIAEEMEFDRKLIHALYREKVEKAAEGTEKPAATEGGRGGGEGRPPGQTGPAVIG